MPPKNRKSAREQTTEELMKRVFHPKVHEHLKEVARNSGKRSKRPKK